MKGTKRRGHGRVCEREENSGGLVKMAIQLTSVNEMSLSSFVILPLRDWVTSIRQLPQIIYLPFQAIILTLSRYSRPTTRRLHSLHRSFTIVNNNYPDSKLSILFFSSRNILTAMISAVSAPYRQCVVISFDIICLIPLTCHCSSLIM